MSEPVGVVAAEVLDGVGGGWGVTEGRLEADPELLIVAVPVSGSRGRYHTATPTAASKTIEVATATNSPVRLRAGARSLPGPAGGGSSPVPTGGEASTGGTGGVDDSSSPSPALAPEIDEGSRRTSLKVSFSTRIRRRVSKSTGFISPACRRVSAASSVGKSWALGLLIR